MRMPGRFGRNIISNAGGNAIHSVIQLGLLFVLIRKLDDTSYAAFLNATFLVGLLEMASDYGARIWATREFSVSESPRSVLKNSVYCKVFYTLVSALALSLIPFNTLTAFDFLLSVLVASTQPSTDPLLWYLRGRERLDIEAVVVLAFRVIVAIGMLAATMLGFGLQVLLLIWLVGNILRMLVEWRFDAVKAVRNSGALVTSEGGAVNAATAATTSIATTIRYVFPVGTAFVLTSFFQRATVFLLDVFATPQDVKIYGTAFKVVSTSGFVATGVFVSSFAMLAKAIAANDVDVIKAVIRRKLLLVTLFFAPFCLLGILLSVPVSDLFHSKQFTDIARVTVLLMPGLYLSCINMGLKYTLNAYELNWQDVGSVVLGIFVLVCATVFHGSLTWCESAALGWGLGEAALMSARLGLLWGHRKHRGVPVGIIFGTAAAMMLMVAISYR